MNRTKQFTTPSNISLEDYIMKTSTNGWLLQISPDVYNFFQKFTLKIMDYFTVIDWKNLFPENNMQEGTVKFFNKTKRFGFITTGKKDIFVHISGLQDNIRQNDEVIFEIENGNNGLNAINVRLANPHS